MKIYSDTHFSTFPFLHFWQFFGGHIDIRERSDNRKEQKTVQTFLYRTLHVLLLSKIYQNDNFFS